MFCAHLHATDAGLGSQRRQERVADAEADEGAGHEDDEDGQTNVSEEMQPESPGHEPRKMSAARRHPLRVAVRLDGGFNRRRGAGAVGHGAAFFCGDCFGLAQENHARAWRDFLPGVDRTTVESTHRRVLCRDTVVVLRRRVSLVVAFTRLSVGLALPATRNISFIYLRVHII